MRHAMIPVERRIQHKLGRTGSVPHVETEVETSRVVRRTDKAVVDVSFHTPSDMKGPVEAGPMTVLLTLVLLRLDLVEAGWVLACRALDRRLSPLVHIPALTADPDDLVILLEH
jgi:hypothetical protein